MKKKKTAEVLTRLYGELEHIKQHIKEAQTEGVDHLQLYKRNRIVLDCKDPAILAEISTYFINGLERQKAVLLVEIRTAEEELALLIKKA